MAHLLIIDLPGGNDTDILEAALNLEHDFSFLSADIDLYMSQPQVAAYLERAHQLLAVPDIDYEAIEDKVLQLHEKNSIDAVICLIDIRLIEASKLAQRLNLHFLNPASALLLRDKFKVRSRLAQCGIKQEDFALAETTQELKQAVEKLGLPLLIKPVDGYGSQNIVSLLELADLEPWINPLEHLLPSHAEYGLGVKANDRLLVERYMEGELIGCDTLTTNGEHQLLGVNQKRMFAPPSFAIQGGCFTPRNAKHADLERYVFDILDAVDFNWGAAHIELMVTAEGPRLVEINPRLVGAKIARLVGYAMNRSIYEDLIMLHLGRWQATEMDKHPEQVAVTRWITASQAGTMEAIDLPVWTDPGLRCVEMLKKPGDHVVPPYENADRLGYVMTCCSSRREAEMLADRFVSEVRVQLSEADFT